MRACLLATPLGNAVRERVRAWAEEEGLEPYDGRSEAGVLRAIGEACVSWAKRQQPDYRTSDGQ